MISLSESLQGKKETKQINEVSKELNFDIPTDIDKSNVSEFVYNKHIEFGEWLRKKHGLKSPYIAVTKSGLEFGILSGMSSNKLSDGELSLWSSKYDGKHKEKSLVLYDAYKISDSFDKISSDVDMIVGQLEVMHINLRKHIDGATKIF